MKLTITTETEYDRAIRHFRDVWRRERDRAGVSLEVLPFIEPASNPQVRKMFALIRQFAYDADVRFEYLVAWFEESFSPPTSQEDPTPKPLDKYSKDEANPMIERIIQEAAEQGHTLR